MIPAQLPTMIKQSSPAPQVAATRSRSRVVLVASSDSSLRERLRHSLSGLRWQVLEASCGAEAWVASQATSLEVLLIDPWLPDLDVTEFLNDFHRENPGVDLIMTDGVSVANSPRSAYHQELLYALRRSQDVDTAAWNVAAGIDDLLDSSPPRASMPNLAYSAHLPQRTNLTEPAEFAQTHQNSQVTAAPVFSSVDTALIHVSTEAVTANADSGTELSGAESNSDFPPSEVAETVLPVDVEPISSPVLIRKAYAAVERIPELVGSSSVMLEVSRRIRLVANRTTPVLIEGPTGSGKELVAEALHRLSPRSRKPFVAINCAAIPEALLEAELFGHTRGAFTGAVQGRMGRIESAEGGTLFLDEIGELPLALQSKLLRFFESGELQRIGDNETVKVDVRIVAATHQPLAEDAQKGLFRADLYYRLAVFLIRTPALAAHMEDLPQLVGNCMERMGRKMPVKRVDGSAMAKLEAHGWPGNVRELEHVLERAAILAGDEPVITALEIDFGLSLMN
jgi:DNA-binding NtrC family response regulator